MGKGKKTLKKNLTASRNTEQQEGRLFEKIDS